MTFLTKPFWGKRVEIWWLQKNTFWIQSFVALNKHRNALNAQLFSIQILLIKVYFVIKWYFISKKVTLKIKFRNQIFFTNEIEINFGKYINTDSGYKIHCEIVIEIFELLLLL